MLKHSANGKMKLFLGWGFSILDSEMLKQEFEKQALESYIKGNYTLGLLNEQGQHIDILIKLKRKDKDQIVTFISGWMVEPDGKIRCATPYGG